ncbi:MAG: SIS domain-containing protein [Francisellaceae bacterium]
MIKTLMEKEAASAGEKIELQLKANKPLWQEICAYLSANKPVFAATVARGSSDHAANFAKYVLETQLGLITASIAPSVYTNYHAKTRHDNALFFGLSQSGKSPDLIQSFKAVSDKATTIALVNVEDSPLASVSRFVVPLHAGAEKSVAATKSYISALVAMVQFVAIHNNDKILTQALDRLPQYLQEAAELDWIQATDCFKLIKSTYIIGRGFGYPIAQEAALKLKETSAIHSEPFSSAEVLHGPFELVKPGFPVLIFAQNDQTAANTIALARRLDDMGANVLFAMPGNKTIIGKTLPTTASLHPLLDPILLIQSFYMMAAKLAVARGLNPDAPANLNKVTETL